MAESNERDVIGIAERNEEDLVLSDVHLGKIVQNPKERSKKWGVVQRYKSVV
jgi:hypothetical protein